jgi:hypothetical protein
MPYASQHLAAKVAAINAAHAETNRLAPLYRALFARYIGAKVTKADGSLLAAIAKQLPEAAPGFQVFSPHVGCFVVKTSRQTAPDSNGFSIAHYAEPYFYAFTLDRHAGNVCQALRHEWEPLRADYTVEGVQEIRAKVEEAEETARKLAADLGPFKMSDN